MKDLINIFFGFWLVGGILAAIVLKTYFDRKKRNYSKVNGNGNTINQTNK